MSINDVNPQCQQGEQPDPFDDPVAYLAAFGIGAVLLEVLPAGLPSAA